MLRRQFDALKDQDGTKKMDAYWRAANYFTVRQIYLQENPLFETPLKLEHIKPRLLGHWGNGPKFVGGNLRIFRPDDTTSNRLEAVYGARVRSSSASLTSDRDREWKHPEFK